MTIFSPVLYYIHNVETATHTGQTMLKLLTGMIIGSLVTYNVILPNEDYKETFVEFNNWTMGKVTALLEDSKAEIVEKL